MLVRIRSKVWNGEALSDGELDLLRRAAQREPGPTLRTTVAQALINADEVPQAIQLLEALRRDYPREVQVHLALGRALVNLEKWSEAEASLLRALELTPGDPEPTKALAALALRRAEWRKARALLDEVLRVDPFDAEAQLLLAEAEATEPRSPPDVAGVKDFTRALVDRLQRQSTPHRVEKNHLLLRLGRGGVARFDLDTLFQEWTHGGRSVEVAAHAFARDLAEHSLGLPPGRSHLLSRVLPVVRDSSFLERGLGAARREGPAGLWYFYAVDDPELVLYVPEGLLGAWRVSLEQLDDAAWKNLAARPTDVRALEVEQGALRLSVTPTGLWSLAHGDGHDAARLFTPSHQASIERVVGPGPYRAYLGLRELVLVCQESDVTSVKKLESLDAAREGIQGTWRFHQGKLGPRLEERGASPTGALGGGEA